MPAQNFRATHSIDAGVNLLVLLEENSSLDQNGGQAMKTRLLS